MTLVVFPRVTYGLAYNDSCSISSGDMIRRVMTHAAFLKWSTYDQERYDSCSIFSGDQLMIRSAMTLAAILRWLTYDQERYDSCSIYQVID